LKELRKEARHGREMERITGRDEPAALARSAAHAEEMLIELELAELCDDRNRTQVVVAQAVNKEQASVSKLERHDTSALWRPTCRRRENLN
jgi:hypothetical protein